MGSEPIIDLQPVKSPPPAVTIKTTRRSLDESLGGWRWAGAGPRPCGWRWRFIPVAIAVLIGIIGVPISAGAWGLLPRSLMPIGWSVTVAGVGMFVAYAAFRRRPLVTIEVYQYGLIYTDGATRATVRWADVAALKERRAALVNALGEAIEREHTFQIRCKDRTEHSLELGEVADTDQLVGYVYEGTLEVMLPQAEQRLAAGRPVEFGPFSVTPVGLSRGTEVLEWGQIARVERTPDGGLIIERTGVMGEAWYEGPGGDIQNLHLLLTLIATRFRGRGKTGLSASRCSLLERYQLIEGAPLIGY
jgi:hypothetical protein